MKRPLLHSMTTSIAVAVAFTAFLAASTTVRAQGSKASPGFQPSGTTIYDFGAPQRGSGFPRYDTALLKLRNDKKLRPLFATGRNEDGKLSVGFRKKSGLEEVVPGGNVADLQKSVQSSGTMSILIDRFSASEFDLPRFAGTDLLSPNPRPVLRLVVTDLKDWKRVEARGKRKNAGSAYQVQMHGRLEIVKRTEVPGSGRRKEYKLQTVRKWTFVQPATVMLRDPVVSKKSRSPGVMRIQTTFEFAGRNLGLGHDDEGPLKLFVQFEGYTVFKNQTKGLLNKTTDMPSLD